MRPIGRVSTVDALTESLRERIFDGDLPPGARLGEAELSTEYGVSRHSLRTAFRAMLSSGLVRHQENHGVYVTTLTALDVHDIYQLRCLLELTAIGEIPLDAKHLREISIAVQDLEQLGPETDWRIVRDLDLNFHRSLVASLDRPRTYRVFLGLVDEMRLALGQIREELRMTTTIARQHRAIFDALAGGDRAEAAAMLRSHLAAAEAEIVSGMARCANPDLPTE